MKSYVTYDADGTLTGAYVQDLLAEHADCHIEVSSEQRVQWTRYRANDVRDGLEPLPLPPAGDLGALKATKNAAIDRWRAEANATVFPYGGKEIAVDDLSWKDILSTAGQIALFGTFPADWPGGWKATDKTYVSMPTIDEFKTMFSAMTARGTQNFNHSQDLKARLAAASTPEEIAVIAW